MKSFLFRFFIVSILLSFILMFIFSRADGYTDAYYLRFTTPKQNSLILGTSRAAQAMQPSVFDGILDKRIYNFAFTNSQSPYGSVYFESIKKKIKKESHKGVFVVAVSPWSISSETENLNDNKSFREENLCLDNTTFVNMNPNIQYLLNNYSEPYYKLLFQENKSNVFLHNDGWLEVCVKMDSFSVQKRLDSKVATYSKLTNHKFSEYRLSYLKKTVAFLQSYGEVYLVRLPIHQNILTIKNDFLPDFERKIKPIINQSSGYYDFTNQSESFTYTNGNHLYKDSGYKISTIISELIKADKVRYIAKDFIY